jgi:hypothetical protein
MRRVDRILALGSMVLGAGCAQILGTQGYVADLEEAGSDGGLEASSSSGSSSGSASGSGSGSSSGGAACQQATPGVNGGCLSSGMLECTAPSSSISGCCDPSTPYYCIVDDTCWSNASAALTNCADCILCTSQ